MTTTTLANPVIAKAIGLPFDLITDKNLKARDVRVFAYIAAVEVGDVEQALGISSKEVEKCIERLVASDWMRVTEDGVWAFETRAECHRFDERGRRV